MKTAFYIVPVLFLLAAASACAQDAAPTADATAFLKWSMAHYAALKTFQADVAWSEALPGTAATQLQTTRTIAYAAPNLFKVTNTTNGNLVFNYICDGKRMVITTQGYNQPPQRFPAPAALADAPENGTMAHPDFGGSVLYEFFAGPDGLAKLLDENAAQQIRHRGPTPIHFGDDATVDGEPCKTVIFGGGLFHDETRAEISTHDGLVRRIDYFNGPEKISAEEMAASTRTLTQYLASPAGKKLSPKTRAFFTAQIKTPAKSIPAYTMTEIYTNIVTNQPIPDATFDTKLPAGTQFAEIGQIVPESAVKPLAGGSMVALSSLRGKVVLIDFWATWCPPCRKGLPDTLALSKEYAGKGLAVLAVTDEDAPTVAAFVKKNNYGSLPVYRDPDRKMNELFGVNAIPTVAVIDRSGKLIAQFVGLQTPETLRAALTKAGLQP